MKEAFEVESKHGAFYTGGNVEWHLNTLYCQTTNSISLLNIEDGKVIENIGPTDSDNAEDSDPIQTFTTNVQQTITSHKSGLLKLWNESGELVKMWKYIHKGPIVKLSLKITENEHLLASAGADGVVRIWDLNHQACIKSLKGCNGVVNVAEFNQNAFYASGDDGKIMSWNLLNDKLEFIYQSHYSKVTGIVFANNGKNFVSSGRDKVIILWKFHEITPMKIIPVNESIETITNLPNKFKIFDFKSNNDGIYVATGGENGVIRLWDLINSKEIFKQDNTIVNKPIMKLICNNKTKTLALINSEHNLILFNLKSFVCLKQFIGFSDEILDITFIGFEDDFIAIATNSNDIKLYNNQTMTCQLLKGHTDIVLALKTSKTNKNLMLSASKDNDIRLWLFNEQTITMNCIGIGKRHTNSVTSIEFSQTNYFVSVSQDMCLKLWELPKTFEQLINLNCSQTQLAHNKDINCVTISPNDQIIATCSQDKTAKLWQRENLNLIGILKGHKRGIWSIRFSSIDQVILTTSADCTIKLWSVNELNCLKTIENNFDSSIIKGEFLSNSQQILTISSDGLIKLFNIKTSECLLTLDEHKSKLWALAIKSNENGFITGGSDSILIKWIDVSNERKLQRQKDDEAMILDEQKLNNYLNQNNLIKALKLALKLNRPLKVLQIIQNLIKINDEDNCLIIINNIINELRNDQKENLMKCAINWNTNSKNCQSAQLIINLLIKQIQCGDFKPIELKKFVEEILPYNERHFKRLTQLMQDLYFINYTVNCMQPFAKDF